MPMTPEQLSGTLFYGDNLLVLRQHFPDDSVDLVYLDPPFNSNASYNVLFRDESGNRAPSQIEAFKDTWHWGPDAETALAEFLASPASVPNEVGGYLLHQVEGIGRNQMTAYLVMMTVRLVELRRVLKPDGAIYLHCDQSASHLLRAMMDKIFGPSLFRSMIIWRRYGSHNDANYFGNVCDHILAYGGTPVRDEARIQLSEAQIERDYTYDDDDGRGRYATAPLHTGGLSGGGYDYEFHGHRRTWRFSEDRMRELEADGRIHLPRRDGGMPRRKVYLSESRGIPLPNYWDDVSALTGSYEERIGFPTQKPEALLDRIIRASSDPGDLILDPFCGCGTAMAAAENADRRWAGIDLTHLAIGLVEDRLRHLGAEPAVRGAPEDLGAARNLAQRNPFQFETWAVTRLPGFLPNERQVGDQGIDGRMRFVKAVDERDRTEYGEAVAQVKSGQVTPDDMRAFMTAIKTDGADLGVFIMLDPPGQASTVPSLAARAGTVEFFNNIYPRIQIWTMADFFEGKFPTLPTPLGREARRML